MNNKISNICRLCNEKVKKYDNNNNGKNHKNWGFFQHNNNLCIIIKPSPFTIIESDLSYVIKNSQTITFDKEVDFNGGSPPVLHPTENIYYIFVHKPNRSYNIWCMCFYKNDDTNQWVIKGYTKEQLNSNPNNDICFVSGAIYDNIKSQWILSGGFNDKFIGFWILKHDYLLSKMTYL